VHLSHTPGVFAMMNSGQSGVGHPFLFIFSIFTDDTRMIDIKIHIYMYTYAEHREYRNTVYQYTNQVVMPRDFRSPYLNEL
jgi:hypothetical protein